MPTSAHSSTVTAQASSHRGDSICLPFRGDVPKGQRGWAGSREADWGIIQCRSLSPQKIHKSEKQPTERRNLQKPNKAPSTQCAECFVIVLSVNQKKINLGMLLNLINLSCAVLIINSINARIFISIAEISNLTI